MRDRGIYGLVLAGGKSERMEVSKAELIYFDRPQWAYCANLLAPFCDKVFISVENADQIADVPEEMQLVDKGKGKGPLSGILSAMRTHPDNTWLVMACDMPDVNRGVLNHLARWRDPDAKITCFADEKGNIEPLLSFWEAGTLPEVESFATSSMSPSGYIKQAESNIIQLDQGKYAKLRSIDTPEERKEFMRKYSLGRDKFEEI